MSTTPAIKLSILERLEKAGGIAPHSNSVTIADLIESIRSHIDALLNTKRISGAVRPQFELCYKSLLNFGLPDLSSLAAQGQYQQEIVGQAIQETISRFEPRLKSIKVKAGTSDPLLRVLRFHINAILQVQPDPQAIRFETDLYTDKPLVNVKAEV